jgi:uncharacterized membrane protein YeaQ/YmgE (transglycosylase-associated protein family)
MTLLGFIILLVVAAIAGACGEMIAGGKVPGGWIGSILAGLVGAWIGSQALFVFVLRLLMGLRRGVV